MARKSKAIPGHVLLQNAAMRKDYEAFRSERGLEHGVDAAEVYAIHCHANGRAYGMSERQIILFLAGKLPFGYD